MPISQVREFPMTGPALLEQAAAVVAGRRYAYGEPVDQFERVAIRWSQVLGTKLTPAQVVLCLVDLKIVRLTHNPKHLDSITDIAGYASILAELLSDGGAEQAVENSR